MKVEQCHPSQNLLDETLPSGNGQTYEAGLFWTWIRKVEQHVMKVLFSVLHWELLNEGDARLPEAPELH